MQYFLIVPKSGTGRNYFRVVPLPGFELECAHTDEGDPWCIVYDGERELVVLHIARIDSRYVMAGASHSKPLTGVIVRRHKRGFG